MDGWMDGMKSRQKRLNQEIEKILKFLLNFLFIFVLPILCSESCVLIFPIGLHLMATETTVLREENIYTENSIRVICTNFPNPIPMIQAE